MASPCDSASEIISQIGERLKISPLSDSFKDDFLKENNTNNIKSDRIQKNFLSSNISYPDRTVFSTPSFKFSPNKKEKVPGIDEPSSDDEQIDDISIEEMSVNPYTSFDNGGQYV